MVKENEGRLSLYKGLCSAIQVVVEAELIVIQESSSQLCQQTILTSRASFLAVPGGPGSFLSLKPNPCNLRRHPRWPCLQGIRRWRRAVPSPGEQSIFCSTETSL